MSSNSIKTWLLTAAVAFSVTLHAQDKPNAEEGKKLYEANNCGSCHALDKKVVGPALRGVHTRRSEEWLVKWVRNNEKFRTVEKDADAIALYNEYGGAAMNIFENLTPAQVLNIVEYIKTAPEPKKTGPVTDNKSDQPKDDSTTIYILLLLVLVFGSVLLVLSKVKNTLRKVAANKILIYSQRNTKRKRIYFNAYYQVIWVIEIQLY